MNPEMSVLREEEGKERWSHMLCLHSGPALTLYSSSWSESCTLSMYSQLHSLPHHAIQGYCAFLS